MVKLLQFSYSLTDHFVLIRERLERTQTHAVTIDLETTHQISSEEFFCIRGATTKRLKNQTCRGQGEFINGVAVPKNVAHLLQPLDLKRNARRGGKSS